jgi:hypothetical protein
LGVVQEAAGGVAQGLRGIYKKKPFPTKPAYPKGWRVLWGVQEEPRHWFLKVAAGSGCFRSPAAHGPGFGMSGI